MTLIEIEQNRSARVSAAGGPVIRISSLLLCIASLSASALAQDPNDLAGKSLEELMNITVTSAAKKEEKLFKTAAAIYVITQEDIRRSGMTTVPDLLRMVPGLDVARIDGTKWAISARGFNDRFAAKLLVLIDGRSVYTPETAGVYWEAIDVPLEDIDRIEVIRGPGGTLWGANAVNGVINIITKQAKDTQGALVAAGAGSEYHPSSLFQYGGKIGQSGYFRACANYLNSGGQQLTSGEAAKDGQSLGYGCARFDLQPAERD
ncbi:MAG TPA: TonB-dependent receptor plug domain-containing protein, partial [Blastocatellia bacterium]